MPSRTASVRRMTAVRGRISPGRRRQRRRWPLWLASIVAAASLVTAAGWFGLQAWPVKTAETVSLQVKTLENALQAESWVVREERVYTAASAGQVSHVVAEGERARVGSPVVKIGGQPMPTDASGTVSYVTDGLESTLTPAQAGKWKPSVLKALPSPTSTQLAEGPVAAGQPVFRLITGFEQSLVVVLPLEKTPVLSPGGKLAVRLGTSTQELAATVAQRVVEGEEVLLHLKVQSSPPELATSRRVQVTLIFSAQSGKAVPRTAIDVRKGLQGVWVVQGINRSFVPVRVTGGNDQDVLLETDLPPGTQILKQAPLDLAL